MPTETAVLRYTIKPEHLEEHLQLLTGVYAELHELRRERFSWITYRVTGTRDFVEVATGHPLPGPLPDLPAFVRYRSAMDDRCETKQFDEVVVVGSYSSP